MRRAPLDDIPSAVVCPAALPVDGVMPACTGVVCGVMRADRAREQGLGINPAQLAVARDGSDGVMLTLTGDPSTIERFCCGDGLPVMDEFEKPGGRDTYTYCPVWQAEKKRIADDRRTLAGGGLEPESVSSWDDGRMREQAQRVVDETASPFGSSRVAPTMALPQAEDPWARARSQREELDFLADGSYEG